MCSIACSGPRVNYVFALIIIIIIIIIRQLIRRRNMSIKSLQGRFVRPHVQMSGRLSRYLTIPYRHRLGRAALAVCQHTVRAGKSIYVPTLHWTPFPCKNGTVCRAGKSIIQMLQLREHQMTVDGLQLCNSTFSLFYLNPHFTVAPIVLDLW